jgi:hypothetical protein
VVLAASAEFVADLVCSSKAEIRDSDAKAAIKAKNILWLQVPVVDAERVAVLDCVDKLQEDIFDEVVLSKVPAVMKDLCTQIIVCSIVHDDIGVDSLLDGTINADNARVGGSQLVQGDFADVKSPSTRALMPRGNQTFDSKRFQGILRVDRTIHNAVAANTKYFNELESSSINESSDRGVDGGNGGERGLGRHDAKEGLWEGVSGR